MTQHDDRITLRQMLDAAVKAEALGRQYSREDLEREWIPRFALVRALEIVCGERWVRVRGHQLQYQQERR
jgi:uncharacterized protein with HEPN domain